MNSVENLHYAIGQLAYAVAFSDRKIQKEEREKFHDIITTELKNNDFSFNISDIIFQILEKDKIDSETTYKWAMNAIHTNGHYLSPELKQKFISVLEKIAIAYPPITFCESTIISRFKLEIEKIHGDPVYYNQNK